MMRSMFSGVSGLRIHQTRMDVIAHNISNVNTVGFKSSRTLFSDVFSQTVQHATGANLQGTGRGGVNAMQIGLGAQVASIDRMMTQGAAQRTDHAFDLMIEGSGFFIVGDASGTYFTRNGAIRPDAFGNILISNGMQLMGWEITGNERDGWQVNRGQVEGITIRPEHQSLPPQPTTQVDFSGNLVPEVVWSNDRDLSATPPVIGTVLTPPVAMTMQVHDSLGNRHTIAMNAQITAIGGTTLGGADPNTPYTIWRLTAEVADSDGNFPTYYVQFDTNGRFVHAVMGDPFDPTGAPASTMTASSPTALPVDTTVAAFVRQVELPINLSILAPAAATFGETGDGTVMLNFSGFTQFGSVRQTSRATDMDGRAAGELTDLSVGQDGTIMGLYSNGLMRPLFQVPLAFFDNPAGLEAFGGSLFRQTINSGNFDGIGQDGVMQGGVLEMSNVDLSAEFTDMIVTQRGFQANSRTITTSDDMLQELVNLRR